VSGGESRRGFHFTRFNCPTVNGPNFQIELNSVGSWLDVCFLMDDSDWTVHRKPYDLRERLFLFACLIVRVVQFLHTRGPIAKELSYQLLKSGTSAGANYAEADDGSSPRDTLAKNMIVLRELKETKFRLRVLRQSGILAAVHDPVIDESAELVKIVATIVRNSRPPGEG
jgi:four helix bundle protein